jgi:tetratricopeptide (TPR) repeat protein
MHPPPDGDRTCRDDDRIYPTIHLRQTPPGVQEGGLSGAELDLLTRVTDMNSSAGWAALVILYRAWAERPEERGKAAPRMWHCLSRNLNRLHDYAAAAKAARVAVHLAPEFVEARAHLGLTYMKLKRYRAAGVQLRWAVMLNP